MNGASSPISAAYSAPELTRQLKAIKAKAARYKILDETITINISVFREVAGTAGGKLVNVSRYSLVSYMAGRINLMATRI